MSTRLYTPLRDGRDAPRSRAEQIYTELRRDLLLGRVPYGARLVEEQLAERFGASRTPVREALRRLEGDGHVLRDPAGGVRPNPPKVSALRDLYEVRVVIEELAVRRAASGGDRAAMAELRDDWAALRDDWAAGRVPREDPDFVYADEGFHQRIAQAAGNAAAARYMRDVDDRIRVLRIHDFTTADRVAATIAEHLEIVEAVVAGRAERAAALMRVHVERSAEVVEERVGALLARMFDGGTP